LTATIPIERSRARAHERGSLVNDRASLLLIAPLPDFVRPIYLAA
jgi:hypothetical protein